MRLFDNCKGFAPQIFSGGQMQKRLVLIAVTSLALASCSAPSEPTSSGSTPSESAASGSTPSESTASESASITTNDRGNLPKKLGETAAIGGDTIEAAAVKFKVTAIKPFKCTYPVDVKGNGQVMAVTLAVETGKDLAEQIGTDQLSFNPTGWRGYTADGTRMNTMSSDLVYNCVTDRSALLPDMGPAEKASGIVLLDAPKWPKSISFSFPQQEGGWEWEVPAK